MFPYYIGIISSLSDLGIIKQSKTPLAGASAGSLIGACFHAGLPAAQLMEATLELAASLRTTGTYRNLGPCLETVLHKYLPDDAHEACSDAAHVAITNVSTRASSTHLPTCMYPWQAAVPPQPITHASFLPSSCKQPQAAQPLFWCAVLR